jgi:medium-chain acyl-[acyl-carrier-protein] hydrolase
MMLPIAKSPWLDVPSPAPAAALRLFCFPFAGGGPAAFRQWPASLPPAVEIVSVRLPGRESRWGERAFTQMGPLVEQTAAALRPYLDQPFAFFGHSMGALLAYELARLLAREGRPLPLHLFVSGRQAPPFPPARQPMRALPEAEFRAELKRLGGTPREVLENNELMELFSPLLRADFTVVETYQHQAGPPLECPITAFSGLQDPDVERDKFDAWRTLTRAGFQGHWLPGNHFFIQTAATPLLSLMSEALRPLAHRARPPQTWPANADVPALGDDDVHAWSAGLEQPPARLDELRQSLAADEHERAARFFFERDRRHFVAGRGWLREVLGRYLRQAPASLRFKYTAEGKPFLADDASGLRFNLAHSHGLALLAVARGRDVGVDVEYIRADFDADSLAENYFSPREIVALRALPEAKRRTAFFACWSRKEAFLKGIGKGLSLALNCFDVSLEPGAEQALLEVRHHEANSQRWTIRELAPAAGYAAAIAVAGAGWCIKCHQWIAKGEPGA